MRYLIPFYLLIQSIVYANKCSNMLLILPATSTVEYGNYILLFKTNTPKQVIDKAKQEVICAHGELGHIYDGPIFGFSAHIPVSYSIQFQNVNYYNDHLETVEQDGYVTINKKIHMG